MSQLIKENWFLIPAAILILAGALFLLQKHRKTAREKKEQYERQLKDQVLNEALRNNMARHTASRSGQATPMEQAVQSGQRASLRQGPVVLHLVVKGRPDKDYVLNLQDPICLGREPQGKGIVLEGEQVAPRHCEIFLYQGHVYIRDLASGRPTVLKRKERQTQVGGNGVQVMTGDRLLIGGIQAQIALMDHMGKVVEG